MPPPYCYDYPRPAVTVDMVVFAIRDEELHVLLIRRKGDPFAGRWALPGGFVEIDEAAKDAARRELREETGIEPTAQIYPLGFFEEPGRDPRGRTISLAFVAPVRQMAEVQGGDDAAEAAWIGLGHLPDLAFDHNKIVQMARDWLFKELDGWMLGLWFLPEEFDEEDVRRLFRVVKVSVRGASAWLKRHVQAGFVAPSGEGTPTKYRVQERVQTFRPEKISPRRPQSTRREKGEE